MILLQIHAPTLLEYTAAVLTLLDMAYSENEMYSGSCVAVITDMSDTVEKYSHTSNIPLVYITNSKAESGIPSLPVDYGITEMKRLLESVILASSPISPANARITPADDGENTDMTTDEKSVIFTGDGKVCYDGREAILTEREMCLFRLLYDNKGRCVSRNEICSAVWDGGGLDTNVVEVYISYLRRKLKGLFPPGAIVSVRGKGYIFDHM